MFLDYIYAITKVKSKIRRKIIEAPEENRGHSLQYAGRPVPKCIEE